MTATESTITLRKREENSAYLEGSTELVVLTNVDVPYSNNVEEGFKGTGLQGYSSEEGEEGPSDSSSVITQNAISYFEGT